MYFLHQSHVHLNKCLVNTTQMLNYTFTLFTNIVILFILFALYVRESNRKQVRKQQQESVEVRKNKRHTRLCVCLDVVMPFVLCDWAVPVGLNVARQLN